VNLFSILQGHRTGGQVAVQASIRDNTLKVAEDLIDTVASASERATGIAISQAAVGTASGYAEQ
jgi:hypothetical protein